MRMQTVLRYFIVPLLLAAIAGGMIYSTRSRWEKWFGLATSNQEKSDATLPPIQEPKVLKLSPQARENLNLVARPVKVQKYVRTILVPGEIVDRPGMSDRGVTSPAVGIVVQVHAFPGDTVRPGDRLFTLRLFSEYLQNTQSELFKATRETEIVKEQREKAEALVKSGTGAANRLAELDQQVRRQLASIQAYRQDLLTRGLIPTQIDSVTEGTFVSTIEVTAPLASKGAGQGPIVNSDQSPLVDSRGEGLAYEVQELKVELGQQVQAGELLSILANHHSLYLVGHAFKQEAPYLERAAQKAWPIQVEFAEDDSKAWPPLKQTFEIHHLANTVDETNRTFDFFVSLTNQSRAYQRDDKTFVVWRFRPGQRVRLHVPVEEFDNVIVLPSAALVREGPEAFVFRQNGDLFDRRPVHVLHQDRLNVVIANDGSVKPGLYVAQSSAASLNRVLKAQAASGVRADVHVHADGTVHAAH